MRSRTLFSIARNVPGSFTKNLPSPSPRESVQTFPVDLLATVAELDDIAGLRSATDLPIVLKGHPASRRRPPRRRHRCRRQHHHQPRWPTGRRVDRFRRCARRYRPPSTTAGSKCWWTPESIRAQMFFKALALGADAVHRPAARVRPGHRQGPTEHATWWPTSSPPNST